MLFIIPQSVEMCWLGMICLFAVAGVQDSARFLTFVNSDDVAFFVLRIFPARHALQGSRWLKLFHESFRTCMPITFSCVRFSTTSPAHPYRRWYINAVGVFTLGQFVFWVCVALFRNDGGSYGSRRCNREILCGVSVCASIGVIFITWCPLMTFIVLIPPPLNDILGFCRVHVYRCSAIKNGVAARR